MPRLFVGSPAPSGLPLGSVIEALGPQREKVKPVDPALYHVTLAFLGNKPETMVDGILDALRDGAGGIQAHEGSLEGLGAFPKPYRARVLWAGIAGTQLDALAEGVRGALRANDIEFDDRHPFHAHLTLARFRDPVDLTTLVDDHADRVFAPFPVRHVHLYESTLRPDGPVYEVRGSAELEA